MDTTGFENRARRVAAAPRSRRATVKLLAGTALGDAPARLGLGAEDAEAAGWH